MNYGNLKQIFEHYIEKFDLITVDHEEIYKWEIAKKFRPMMDTALESADFADKLREIKKLTENLVDSYTQPFSGLCYFADCEPDEVKRMFRELLSDDHGDLAERHRKNLEFLNASHALRDKYSEGSFLYNDDYHSVSTYVFLYDPENHYIFKSTHALKFADCIEYYDDWGYGMDIKLDVYYRMCRQVTEAIMKDKDLLATDAGRFLDKDGNPRTDLHPDINKHILTFDIIYSCSVCNLFEGISFDRPNSRQKQLYITLKNKAQAAKQRLDLAEAEYSKLLEAQKWTRDAFAAGKGLVHKSRGLGKVCIIETVDDNTRLIAEFEGVQKKLGLYQAVSSGAIRPESEAESAGLEEAAEVLKRLDRIKNELSAAQNVFAEYKDFLE